MSFIIELYYSARAIENACVVYGEKLDYGFHIMDSEEKSRSFISRAMGAVSIEFWSERFETFFKVKFFYKSKKKQKNRTIKI